MAKITRYLGNVLAFATNKLSGEKYVFGSSTSDSDALSDQLTTEYLRGWGTVGASEFPPLEWFNAAMFTSTQFIAYLHQMGVAEWDSAQEYHTGSVVVYNGGVFQSRVDSNTGVTPGTDNSKWYDVIGVAPNKIKTSQFVVEGTTGDPLPSTTPTDYLVGAEIAFGWVVTSDCEQIVVDSNGNIISNNNTGVVEYTFNKADNETPNAASLFSSVMRCTDSANSVYVQDYADGSNGISITETATTVTMAIDFSSFAGGVVFGVSEQVGRLPIDSVLEIGMGFPLSHGNLYHIQDQKPSATPGGGALAATYNTRDLNTELIANISDASLSSNQITLPTGTYFITASSQAHQVDRHRLYLYNATDATYDIIGENAYTGTTTTATSFARLEGVINIASSKVFELRHYTTTAKTNNGLGVDVSNGDTEVYTDIKIWRVA